MPLDARVDNGSRVSTREFPFDRSLAVFTHTTARTRVYVRDERHHDAYYTYIERYIIVTKGPFASTA